MTPIPSTLARKINSFKIYLKKLALYKGIAITLLSLICVYLLCLFLDRTFHLPDKWRFLLLVLACFCGFATLIVFCLIPLFRRYKDEHIALAVEEKYPELSDRLISAVELSRQKGEGMSEGLIKAAGEQVSQSAEGLDFKIAAPRKRLKIALLSLLVVLFVVLGYTAIFPEAAANVLARLLRPYAGIPPFSYTKLKLLPADTVVPRGEDVRISIFTQGKRPRQAKFYWQSKSSVIPHVMRLRADKDMSFHYLLRSVMEPAFYWTRAGDAYSRRYTINVTDRPAVTDIKIEYAYPEYTGLGKEICQETLGDISAVLGTKVRLFAKASKEITCADLEFGAAAKTVKMKAENRNLEGPQFTLLKGGFYSIHLKDKYDFSNREPAKHKISVRADKTPHVKILKPDEYLFITPDEKVKVSCVAKDDFGIKEMSLSYKILHGVTENKIPETEEEIQLGSGTRTTRELKKDYLWPMDELSLNPGDIIEYYTTATDYDSMNGPNRGKSLLHHIYVTSREERWEEMLDWQEELFERLQELIERQELSRQNVADLIRKLEKEDLKQLKELIENEYMRQERIRTEDKNLSKELQELMKKMAQNKMGLESLPMMDYIHEELLNIADNEMAKILQHLIGASRTPTLQLLNNASQEQLKALEKLRELLKTFFNLLPEQKIDKLLMEAIQLAIRQDRVKKNTRSLVPGMLGRLISEMPDKERNILSESGNEEKKLSADTTDFMEKLERTEEELDYMNLGRKEAVSKAHKRLESEKVPEEMKEISKLLEKNQLLLSLPREERVSEILWQVVKDLQGEMLPGMMCGGDMGRLYEALLKLMKIIEEQKRLNTDTKEIDSLRPSEELPEDLWEWLKKLAEKQDDIKGLTQELEKLIKARTLSLAEEKMGESHMMLESGKSGEKVQKVQKEIIDILTAMMQMTCQQMMAMGAKIPGSALMMALGSHPGGYFTMAAPPATGTLTIGGPDTWAKLPSHLQEELLELDDEEYPPEFRDLLILYYRQLGKK